MRHSGNEMKDGQVVSGFDYDLQVWVENGVVLDCGHSEKHRSNGYCCDAHKYAGQTLANIKR